MTEALSGKFERVPIPYEYFEAIRNIAEMRQMRPEAVTIEILRLGFHTLETQVDQLEAQRAIEATITKTIKRSRRR